MHPRTEELLSFLLTSQIRLREAVDAVAREVRDTAPADGRWSVAQVLEHLAMTEASIARLIQKKTAEARAAGVGPETETSSILWTLDVHRQLDRRERFPAPDRLVPTGALSVDDTWHRLQETNAGVRHAVAATDGLALGGLTYPHPSLGVLNLYQWIIFVGAHELRHAIQIREIGAETKANHEDREGT